MVKRNHALRPFLIGSVIFLTLGVAIASETLSRLGLEGNYVYLFSMAFVVAAIMRVGQGRGLEFIYFQF